MSNRIKFRRFLSNSGAILLGISTVFFVDLTAQGQTSSASGVGKPHTLPDAQDLAPAQSFVAQSPPASNPVTTDTLEALVKDFSAASNLTEQQTKDVQQLIQAARAQLQAEKQAATDAAAFAQTTAGASEAITNAKAELTKPVSKPEPPPSSTDLSDLQQQLSTAQSNLTQAQKELSATTNAPAQRQARMLAIPDLLSTAESQLVDVGKNLAVAPPAEEPPLLTQAKKTQLLAQQQSLTAQIDAYKKELASYAATTDLVPLQRQLADRQVSTLQPQVDVLQTAIASRRQGEADRWNQEIAKDLQAADPAVRAVAEVNQQLVEQYGMVNQRVTETSARVRDVRDKLEAIKSEYETTTKRVEAVGLTEALGLLLRQDKVRLQAVRKQYSSYERARSEMQRLQVEMFRSQDELAGLNQNASQAAIAVPATPNGSESASKSIAGSAMEAATALRIQILNKLVSTQSELFQNLVALDTESRQLIELIDRYLNFIEGNILWIRSASALSTENLVPTIDAARWLLSPVSWKSVAEELAGDFRAMPVRSAAVVIVVIGILITRRRRKHYLMTLGQAASKRNCQTIVPTAIAMLITFVASAIIPLIIIAIGWMCIGPAGNSEFLRAIGYGLNAVGIYLLPIELVRRTVARDGLASNHFRWTEPAVNGLSAYVRWFYFAIPLLFVAVVINRQSNLQWQASLGRFALIGFWMALGAAIYALLRPRSSDIAAGGEDEPSLLIFRSRRWLLIAVFMIPGSLIVLSTAGYHYTAVELSKRVLWTTVVAIGTLIVSEFFVRYILVHRRKLALLELHRGRERKREAVHDERVTDATGIEVEQKQRCDLITVSRQSRQTVRILIGLAFVAIVWNVWKGVLPAIDILDHVTLWTVGVADQTKVVTLKDLLLTGVILVLTITAVKNMPGLLELILLQRLPLDSGARYAVATIFRYCILVVGLVMALSFLNIPWSHYSWIVAAGTVGLGFGMQEIVANFVSGIIILLERPIRVGDIVTVDGNTGVVTRIQMRAATITNWDRQELIVPNKTFITGNILNWSLSNLVNRIVINVGVAYGSDPEQVRECLLKVAEENAQVMDDPSPVVSMEGFGDSALNFVLRCYLPSLENRINVTHELYATIARELDAIGVSIPFPQRDLHIIDPSHS